MVSVQIHETTAGNLTAFDRVTPAGVKMAAVIVAVTPILLVYPFIQKYFIYGAFTGSVKG
jgi:putative aldouronate transport system permease protein